MHVLKFEELYSKPWKPTMVSPYLETFFHRHIPRQLARRLDVWTKKRIGNPSSRVLVCCWFTHLAIKPGSSGKEECQLAKRLHQTFWRQVRGGMFLIIDLRGRAQFIVGGAAPGVGGPGLCKTAGEGNILSWSLIQFLPPGCYLEFLS